MVLLQVFNLHSDVRQLFLHKTGPERNITEINASRTEWKGDRVKGGERRETAGEATHTDP